MIQTDLTERYKEVDFAVHLVTKEIRRLSISELMHRLQDLELDDYYSSGEIGLLYLERVNQAITDELQRRKTLPRGYKPTTEIIPAIKARADIVEVLERFTDTFAYQGKYIYRCTLHGADRTPSGVIYKETNTCWCFACQKGGDCIDVVKLFGGMDTSAAIRYLCQFYGILLSTGGKQ